jgi:hypothetical protein
MSELKRRGRPGEIVAPSLCIAGLPLCEIRGTPPAKVICLSPSNAAVVTMQTRIREELVPRVNGRRLRVPALRENDSSVVLEVTVGAASILLGADLEERTRPGLGWQVILDTRRSDASRFGGFKNSTPRIGYGISSRALG